MGAGFDRIAQAWFVDQTDPKELAARATVRLEHLRPTNAATAVVDLLER
ncbi:MAG: hypothetical protein ACFCGT_13225 [Sandaracinaceae bacterium]